MKSILLISILSILCITAFGQQRDWIISGYSSTLVRHEVVSPGSFKVEGDFVSFLYKGITETVEIPEYHDKPLCYIDDKGKVVFEAEFWNFDKVKMEHERDEEWQRKGYPVEFRAFMIHTLKRLSIERANSKN